MTSRHFTTDQPGAIVLSASILGIHGVITVDASEKCERASVTIRTDDEEGPAAEAVRTAELGMNDGTLVAQVTGEDHGSGITQSVFTRGGRTTVIQSGGTIRGNVTGVTIVDGQVITGGSGTVVQHISPVEITVTVPLNSTVISQSDSSALTTTGPLAAVSADTQSGRVEVERAQNLRASTMSGAVSIGAAVFARAKTMSGAIHVSALVRDGYLDTMSGRIQANAVGGGLIQAHTMSGAVDVTATPQAIQQGFTVRASSMSGHVSTPRGCAR
ncbi:DUF4097 family beta strand repeat protein [Streptomyces sp. SID8379]|uniref:DUF4097 family beta strand repeat-containing protein n=1 Tax=unclassified Streptomyces TaxID=2593676 RepID=UPI0003612D9F|nr:MULTISPECIES: DUF4097 family beta strand repeat-containing protein [unclassified Streptomyces]MYW70507.1 DUF4097 family beta strand repeat protein [Streptomyces sp. SID8379]